MPTIKGSSGKLISYEVLGVAEVINELTKKGKMVSSETEIGLVRAGAFVAEEVKESIAGRRGESRSVNTGEFLNSISVDKIDEKTVSVKSDVPQAQFMEYGTSRGIEERRHFRNTAERTKDKVKEEIENVITKVISE